jgi:hypothetical protein
MEGARSRRLFVATVALAALIAGCGGDGDARSKDAAAASDSPTSDSDPAVAGGDRAQIAELVDDVQDALLTEDGGLCFELTEAQVRRLAASLGRRGADCHAAVHALYEWRREHAVRTVRSRVLKAPVTGGYGRPLRSTATVADPSGAPYHVGFVTRNGRWRLARFRPATRSGIGVSAGNAAALGGGRLLVRGVDARVPRADGRLYELGAGGDRRRVGDVSCKRVHASSSGIGLCLAVAASGTAYEGIVLDRAYRPSRRFPVEGIPDRARVSPDGRFGAYTSFDAAGSQGYFTTPDEFSTYTRIHDMRNGRELLRLEDLRVTRQGERVPLRGAELWGVTFASAGRFYATLAVARSHYLIAGRVGDRRARVIRDQVECPALSPDGRRIAYKRRVGGRNEWRFHVLDLRDGRDVALAERRSIDDQPEWLGDRLVAYSDDRATFAVPSDGGGAPRLVARQATSPARLGG